MDNPEVRSNGICPLCFGPKTYGLVTCWPCYHRHGLKYGNPEAEQAIARRERLLTSAVIRVRPRHVHQ
jgi:hypothetical protein